MVHYALCIFLCYTRNMRIPTSQKILDYLKDKKHATPNELTEHLSLMPRAVFKQLKNLYTKGQITKIGKPPKVFYLLSEELQTTNITDECLPRETRKVIEKNWLFITPIGQVKTGLSGFINWCQKNHLPVNKTANEYLKTLKKYNRFKKNDLIDGMSKMKSTFKDVWLDRIYYLDFYSIERFGKTKLGQLLLYAKQSQNKELIKELITSIRPQINHVIKKYRISAVGFIPPTIKREVQFMKELRNHLHITLPLISIIKVKTPITIPQKALSKLEDRVENARKTLVVEPVPPFKNILLIDDAVGSGATLNETAKQIRQQKVASGKIIGLAITGSFKGFDVISEV